MNILLTNDQLRELLGRLMQANIVVKIEWTPARDGMHTVTMGKRMIENFSITLPFMRASQLKIV